jgi:GT2 family glycosyltransferase/glycosyltransferase involved in cell wall biosynthesis
LRSQGKIDAPSEALAEITQGIESQLFQREQEIWILESRLAESQRRIENRERELLIRDDARAAREQEFSRDIIQQLVKLNDSILQKSAARSDALSDLERRHAEQARALRALGRTVEELLQRSENQADKDKADRRITELEKGLQFHVSEAAEKERIIRARDEAIAWLRGEVENYQKISLGLASVNGVLNQELAEKDAQVLILREAVQTVELELVGLKMSRGWRLLNLLRKVRRWLRSVTGRDIPEPEIDARPAIQGGRTGAEWQANLTPLLEEVRTRLAGLSGATPSVPAATPEVAKIERPKIRLLPAPQASELRLMLDEEPSTQGPALADVICFSVIDWEFRYQRPQQIMSQFAAHGHRVFYISTSRFTPAGSAPRVKLKSIKENVYEIELCAVHQPDVYGEMIGGINQSELEASIEELRSRFSIDEAISYVMLASWTGIALRARERWGWRVIYDCMDEWDRFPGIKEAIVEAEKQLVEECDLLVVSSGGLSKKWSSRAEKLVLARNAVDYDFYHSRIGPSRLLSDEKRPIVGYFGAIADWFDLKLLAYLVEERPNYTFVLLGGVFDVDVAELISKPNVRMLGQHPYELMPKYLYRFDVCIIPFKINPITEATDPVKLYEYLSSGKPVVSVKLPEVEVYREHLYIAENREDFVALLDQAINDDDPESVAGRRALARANDWKNRYEVIVEGLAGRTRRVSIIIITYNNLELTKLCLKSVILNTDYPNYEVIVVDNHSTDGTRAYLQFMAERHPHLRIILNDANEGFARANNQGLEASTGDDLVLLNNDTIVPRGWLSRLVRHLRHNEVGMVGPVSNFVGNEARIEVDYQTWEEMESFARQHTRKHDGQGADIQMLGMFCVAMRRDVYTQVGPLDEQFGLGMFEDDDYAHRVRLKGYRVICAADAFVHHFGQASFKKLIETGEYNPLFERNLKTFESKWQVKWSPRSGVPLDFRADYAVEMPLNQNGRFRLSTQQ